MAEKKISKELFQKAVNCKNAEELIALCAGEGVELAAEEAEKFLSQVKDQELSIDSIEKVDGGSPCVGAVSIGCVGLGLI